MKISTRTQYGLRLMVQLALHHKKGSVFLKEIANKENISEKYLSQIIIPLKGSGLVISNRGAHGGYTIGKSPSKITVAAIVSILEGDLKLIKTTADTSTAPEKSSYHITQKVWKKVEDTISKTLKELTLDDLVESYKKTIKTPLTYNI